MKKSNQAKTRKKRVVFVKSKNIRSIAAKNRNSKKICVDCKSPEGELNSKRNDKGPWRLDRKSGRWPLCGKCWCKRNKKQLAAKERKRRREHGHIINARRNERYLNDPRYRTKRIRQQKDSDARRSTAIRKQKKKYNSLPSIKKRRKKYNRTHYSQPKIKKRRNTRDRKKRLEFRKKWFTLLGGIKCRVRGCLLSDIRGLETDHIAGNGKKDPLKDDRSRYYFYKNKPKAARKKYQVLCGYHHAIKTFKEKGKSHKPCKLDWFSFIDNGKCRAQGCKTNNLQGFENDHILGGGGKEKPFNFCKKLEHYQNDRQKARKTYQVLCRYHHDIKSYLEKQKKIRRLDADEIKILLSLHRT